MIRLIQGRDRRNFPREIDEMFRLRARVFRDRMGWDVVVKDGWEIDAFDDLDPLYLLSLDDREVVRGCARLLPTTGPNMLNDVFSALLPGGNPIRSALMWESSRFSVDHASLTERTEKRMNRDRRIAGGDFRCRQPRRSRIHCVGVRRDDGARAQAGRLTCRAAWPRGADREGLELRRPVRGRARNDEQSAGGQRNP